MLALEKGNQLRGARKVILDEIRRLSYAAGNVRVAGLLDDVPDEVVGGMRVVELLAAPYRRGVHQARFALDAVGVGDTKSKRVRDLTLRQRAALIEIVAPGYWTRSP